MHLFLKFIFGTKLYMFRTVPLSIIRRLSLYTRQWYMSYRLCWQLASRIRTELLLRSQYLLSNVILHLTGFLYQKCLHIFSGNISVPKCFALFGCVNAPLCKPSSDPSIVSDVLLLHEPSSRLVRLSFWILSYIHLQSVVEWITYESIVVNL